MAFPADVARPADAAAASGGEWFSPARMLDVELTEPLPALPGDGHYRRAWVLGRLHTEPVGACMAHVGRGGLTPDQLGALLWEEVRGPVRKRFAEAGLSLPGRLTGAGLNADPATWPYLRHRRAVLAAAPFISVVIPTRDRPERAQTWFDCLSRQEYPRFEIVVVENVPTNDVLRNFVEAAQGTGTTLRYVCEPRPGNGWACNAGTAASSGEIITFCGDDGEPDRHWLAGLACGFARWADIGCVTGPVVPARLDTQAQELFEQLGGFCKGRGFSPAIFSRHGPQNPLYPVPPFGVGANLAFRREALNRIGGIDVALGPGTPARASEDMLAMTLVLLAGYRLAYEPGALMRHDHRRDLDSLREQAQGHGVGLTAFYAALLRHRPSVLPGLMRLAPTAVRYLLTADSASVAGRTRATAPQDLTAGVRRRYYRSALTGPMAYMRSVRRQARVAKLSARQA